MRVGRGRPSVNIEGKEGEEVDEGRRFGRGMMGGIMRRARSLGASLKIGREYQNGNFTTMAKVW